MVSRWLAPFLYFVWREAGYKTGSGEELPEFNDFRIIWSVPFEPCFKKLPENITNVLKKGGITINENGNFKGNQITTFYRLGLYPEITSKGDVNGGIPQLSHMTDHLVQTAKDIESAIPNANFSGLALIDWESWRPVYDFNFGSLMIYQKRSLELVKQQHPDWPFANLTAEAMRQWETSARNFMEGTLILAKKIRPLAKWCFYGFPDCYNYYGKTNPEEYFCSGNIMEGNNKLQWMWKKTSALCPSLYIRNHQLADYNLTQRSWYTYGRIAETSRVSSFNIPIYPYINYYVFDGGRTVPRADFARLLGQSAAAGLEGVVIWGSSKNLQTKDDCQDLYNYIKDILIPAYHILNKNLKLCKDYVCGGIGRCIWDKRDYNAWKTLYQKEPKFNTKNILCTYQPKK